MGAGEHLVIDAAFVLATMVMATAVVLRWHRTAGSPEPPAVPGANRVAPPGMMPLDLAGVAAVVVLYFAFHWMGAYASPPPDGLTDDAGVSAEAVLVSILAQAMIAGMIVVIIAPRCDPLRFFGLRWASWPHAFVIAPAVVAFMWAVLWLLQAAGYFEWIQRVLGAPAVQESVGALRTSDDPLVLGLLGVAAVVVAPLCEELVFRGYLYPVVKRFGGAAPAAAGSALLFAAAHSHATGLLPLFILGLLLVAVYEWTGSLWASIAVHACFNGFTVAITAIARIHQLPLDLP